MGSSFRDSVPGSVLQAAREDLRKAGRQSARQILRSWTLPGKPQAIVAPIGWNALLLVAGIPFKKNGLSSLAPFAPENPGSVLLTMWQVQAAVTAIAFPFLTLLIELSRQRQMAAKSTTEVLTRRTYVIPALMFSIAGTAGLGIASAWLASHAMVVLAFVGILVPTILFLAWCYWSAFRLLSYPELLKEAAYRLLEEKLRASMDRLWVYRRANSILQSCLPDSIQHAWRDPSRDEPGAWHVVPAPRSGVVADVNPKALLNAIPLVSVATQEEEARDQVDSGSNAVGEATVRMLRLCGDKVVAGEPLVVFDARGLSTMRFSDEQIAGAFRIEDEL